MANTTKKTENAPEAETISVEELLKQIKELKQQIADVSDKKTNTSSTNVSDRKVKVISLIPNQASLTTEQGGGKQYTWNGYGSSRKIRFDDLEALVNTCKEIAIATQHTAEPLSFFERGEFYICDADVVTELGLEDYYDNILDKSKIDKIVELKDDVSIELFKGANTATKERICTIIRDKIISGVEYDKNRISEIKEISGIDILNEVEKYNEALETNKSK